MLYSGPVSVVLEAQAWSYLISEGVSSFARQSQTARSLLVPVRHQAHPARPFRSMAGPAALWESSSSRSWPARPCAPSPRIHSNAPSCEYINRRSLAHYENSKTRRQRPHRGELGVKKRRSWGKEQRGGRVQHIELQCETAVRIMLGTA